MDGRPDISRGATVRVTELGIMPWTGTVTAVKPSKLSGWHVEVRRPDGFVWCVPAGMVEVMADA